MSKYNRHRTYDQTDLKRPAVIKLLIIKELIRLTKECLNKEKVDQLTKLVRQNLNGLAVRCLFSTKDKLLSPLIANCPAIHRLSHLNKEALNRLATVSLVKITEGLLNQLIAGNLANMTGRLPN